MSVRRAAAVALACVLVGLLLAGAVGDASVADEHPHLLSGMLLWAGAGHAGGFDNPPLGQLWIAAPLHLLGLDYAFPSDAHLLWARLPVLLTTLLLAGLLFLWGRDLFGAHGGLLVLGLLCLEPTLLAHGHLATLDVPLTFAWWAALWSLRRWVLGQRGAAVGFCLATAAAILVKFTGLLLLPLAFLVGLIACRTRRQRLHLLLLLAAAVGATWLAAVALYGVGSWRMGFPGGFVETLAGKWQHREEGHFSYLAGRRSMQGFPEYHLVALAVKTPLPLLLLSAAGFVLGWRSWSRLDRALLGLSPVLLLVVFTWGGVHVGVRHLLPLHPGLLLCAAAAVVAMARARRGTRVLAAVAVAAWAVGVLGMTPQWLAYFNVAAGGPARGDRWLLDSNLDWGQDDDRLRRFLAREESRGRSWTVNPPAHQPRTGNLVVNVNELHALLRARDTRYDWLRRLPPAGHVGWSWRTWEITLETYRRSQRRHPDDAARLADLAQALAHAGQTQQARELLRARRDDTSGRVAHAAVEIALQAGDLQEAAAWLRSVAPMARQRPEHARLDLELQLRERLAAAASPATAARARMQLGMFEAERGDLESALPHLRAAAQALPDDVPASSAWMVGLSRQGRYAQAAAVARAPALAGALDPEARLLERMAGVQARLDHVLEEGGALDVEALRGFALAEFEAERADAAAAALIQILRQQPSDRDALNLLGEIQVRCKLRILAQRLTPRSLRPRPAAGRAHG